VADTDIEVLQAAMGLKVLIVDDSSVMRKILERSLRQAWKKGIDSVVEAGDGGEALEKLGGEVVHVILTEINMPNVNGLDFLRRLKESPHRNLPVIMVTTEGGEKTVLEAISLGAKGFIRKPFTAEQMEAALQKAIAA
jgi:two-component system chemotaxis response regulator CheY